MLLWRIGAGALLTKVNLNQRFDHIDPTCILCNNAEESPMHLFFAYSFARALWASACWGLRIDTSSHVTDEDIIKLILIPSNSPFPSHNQWIISLNMELIIDEIWRTRNLIQFQDGIADIHLSKKNVQTRFLEYSRVFSITRAIPTVQPTLVWTPPPHGWIKLNVDPALNSSKSALAMVARDHLATRILAPILTNLVLLLKTCEIWNSSSSGFAWALLSKIDRCGGLAYLGNYNSKFPSFGAVFLKATC
ncbi:hypothetical protein SO802_015334 [Lithocarpus litseifolius]|uniref:Reverse transcriptase zinc-binding domain-containing protein n=1 Tax=Lithocarpus litseifolius TaxID=425828 RepID=A0AAW2CVS4_9ROSI